MILLVDLGNTRLKWRVISKPGQPFESGACTDSVDALAESLPASRSRIDHIVMSTVKSDADIAGMLKQLEDLFQAPVSLYWSEKARGGLRNAYADPSCMGADRWHAMLGARGSSQRGCVIVDAGSAVTVDFVSDGGQHLGGYILPGLPMVRRALSLDAARIGDAARLGGFEPGPGRTTGECVSHGLWWSIQAMSVQIREDASSRGLSTIYVTGGDAPVWQQAGLGAVHRENLVLDGLERIAQEGGIL